MRSIRFSTALPVALVAACLLRPSTASADQPLPLAAAVAAAAKAEIVPALEKAGVTSVGVLKFLAVDGTGADAAPSPRLGAINTDLAAQFQTAILLNLSRKNPVAVLRDPGAVAAGIPGASHLSAEGLEKLFAAEYPVVVGAADAKVKPDAFIFGIVQVADDLQTVNVDARLVRRGTAAATPLCTFAARLGADNLPAAGQSFVATRGLFTGGAASGGGATTAAAPAPAAAERPIKLASLAADVRAGRRPFPLQDPEAPVTLSIAYDSVEQRIEFRDGGAFVAEPRQGQTVVITLRKTKTDGQRYAVALKVNGENTAERDVRPDIRASKWVLSDDYTTIPVRGYSVGTTGVQPFLVLSDAESAQRAFDYGVDAGTITMTVFTEQTGTPPPGSTPPANPLPPRPDATPAPAALPGGAAGALDKLLLAGGVRVDPKQSFESLDAAKSALQTQLASANRGLITPEAAVQASEKRIVPFQSVPDPIMSVVIRYFTRP